MDRREAIKAFLALPVGATITRAQVKPSDVLVIERPDLISDELAISIRRQIHQAFGPDQKVVVLGDGAKLRVMTRGGG